MCSALESSLEVTGETAHSERAQGHYFKQCPLPKHSHFFSRNLFCLWKNEYISIRIQKCVFLLIDTYLVDGSIRTCPFVEADYFLDELTSICTEKHFELACHYKVTLKFIRLVGYFSVLTLKGEIPPPLTLLLLYSSFRCWPKAQYAFSGFWVFFFFHSFSEFLCLVV